MRYLSIKNFKKHQHYKDRRPPWIKLHAEVLDDYHFGCLQDASKAHLMLLWVLASKHENKIPYDLAWITKELQATDPVDVEELVLQGFIEVSQDDSKPLARRPQSAMPETEAERESETKKKKSGKPEGERPSDLYPFDLCERLRKKWEGTGRSCEYPRFRKQTKALFIPGPPRFSEAQLATAIDAFDELAKADGPLNSSFWHLQRFVDNIGQYVEWGEDPGVDPNTHAPTRRGRFWVERGGVA